jgi:tetratricopeptide (TPR) repeat protein
MGAVYRALDRVTGGPVALKLMSQPGRHDERFAQEARVLAKLQHPAIVRYVAHGSTASGQAYLAMQWLDGEDLARRWSRMGLSVGESLAVARRLAEALSVAHARGVIHRDVKPSNVMLVAGDPAHATLLDFGIVRLGLSGMATTARAKTQTGTVLGTVGYMSPEQAIAEKELDARTDVFALGCVLFECLTGRPAFSGDHPAAVLAKVLREEAPRVRTIRPDLPAALDDLVARMLAKERAGRPQDGTAVFQELQALGIVTGGVPTAGPRPSGGVSGGELRLMSVLLASVPHDPDRISDVVRRHGGDLACLANGELLVTLGSKGPTSDQVVSAANCALALHAQFPAARFALAIGRAQTNGRSASGPVIDRAADLLAQSTTDGIRIDEATADLLAARFDVRGAGSGQVLVARRAGLDTPRMLLGKPTPCVGRDKEIALVEATWRECVEESVARAVLVTGPPGQGKSRLRHEIIARVAEAYPDASILVARADPVGAGSSFLLARQLVRAAAGLQEGGPVADQDAKLRRYVASRCASEAERIADFLGELMGAPTSGPPGPDLRVARNDPQIMAERLRQAFVQWLTAECAQRPLLVVLEDLHWGDVPSVMYLGESLRTLSAQRLMVLALARPEVHEAFPTLWQGAETTELSLGRLTPRAAERLVRTVLGAEVSAETVARVLERAQGNAFFLEELIRRVAEGGGESLPETVLALVQSRLEKLDADSRRVARAASVFGEVFWRGALGALLGGDPKGLDGWIARLTEDEIVTVAQGSRFPGEREYTFRHGLVREVAYSMLTEADAVIGHGLAGEWLEARGERDALTLADHFERGGHRARAVPWLVRAARGAHEAGNLVSALAVAERGLTCGAKGIDAARLHIVVGVARYSRGEVRESAVAYGAALELFPLGSTERFQAAAGCFLAGSMLGDPTVTALAQQAVLQDDPPQEPSGPYGFSLYHACIGLSTAARFNRAFDLLERARVTASGPSAPDPAFVNWFHLARTGCHVVSGQPGLAIRALRDAEASAPSPLSAYAQAASRMFRVWALAEMGQYSRAEEAARELVPLSEFTQFVALSSLFVAIAKVDAGRASETIHPLRDLLEYRNPFVRSFARAELASALIELQDLDAAQREADAALQEGAAVPHSHVATVVALARIALLQGRPADASELAARGLSITTETWSSKIVTLYLVRAEALMMLGNAAEARAAIVAGRDYAAGIASTIENAELRDSFRTNVLPNARVLSLARQWVGEGPTS